MHTGRDGRPDAFARYALDQHWPDGVPSHTLRVIEIQAVDAAAEAALWNYLFGIDLVGTVQAGDRPVDDQLRWRLPDPRRLRVRELRDHLWVRVVDVAGALGARTYGTEDALVVELVDEFRTANGGQWLIEGGSHGATCARTDRAPDLTLGAPGARRALPRRRPGLDVGRRRARSGAHERGGAPRRLLLRRASVAVVHDALLNQPMAALSWAMASIGPGSTSFSSAR